LFPEAGPMGRVRPSEDIPNPTSESGKVFILLKYKDFQA
jgi:hypothetical protein